MTNTQPEPTANPITVDRLSLLANGYEPIPVKGKRPHINGWRKIKLDERIVSGLSRTNPDHTNTGLRTGRLVAIDIDVLDSMVVDRIASLVRKLPGGDRAPCRTGRAPKCLYVFRTATPSKKRETAEFRIDGKTAQIEILGEGQQFVAFGTHPETGKPYEWHGASPLDQPIDELPLIDAESLDRFLLDAERVLEQAGTRASKAAVSPRPTGGGTFWTSVNSAALAAPERWVPDLFSTARRESGTGAWRVSSKDLGRPLEEDLSIAPSGIKDFGREKPETAINLVVEYGGAPTTKDAAFWLCERLGQDPVSLGWVEKHSGVVLLAPPIKVPTPSNDDAPDWVRNEEDWVHEESEIYRSTDKLSDLTHPGGFIEELIDWIVSSAAHPSRELALSAVIPFVGALIGRRFSGNGDCRSNIYAVALAPSGYGKDHARQQIKRLVASAHLHKYVGPARIMSASALRNALMEKPSMVCLVDEVDGPLGEMLDRQAGQHTKALKNELLDFFSNASTVYEGAAYAQVRAVEIHTPNLCIYGTSTPDAFWESIKAISALDGFLALFLLFNIDSPKPDFVTHPSRDVTDVPQRIRDGIQKLVLAGRGTAHPVGSDSGGFPIPARRVGTQEAAAKRWRDFKIDMGIRAEKAESSEKPVLNRAAEHAVKLALIVAVATNPNNPEITDKHMSWAIQLAWLSCCALLKESKLRIADSIREASMNRILQMLYEAGTKGMPTGQLADKTRGIDRRMRDELLDDLRLQKRIVSLEYKPPKGGIISTRHYHRDYKPVS